MVILWLLRLLVDHVPCVLLNAFCDGSDFPAAKAEEGQDVEKNNEKLAYLSLPDKFVSVVAGHQHYQAN